MEKTNKTLGGRPGINLRNLLFGGWPQEFWERLLFEELIILKIHL